jgi:hypothetical protein
MSEIFCASPAQKPIVATRKNGAVEEYESNPQVPGSNRIEALITNEPKIESVTFFVLRKTVEIRNESETMWISRNNCRSETFLI